MNQAEHVFEELSERLSFKPDGVRFSEFKFSRPPSSGFEVNFFLVHHVPDWEHALLDVVLISRATARVSWRLWFQAEHVAHGECEGIAGHWAPSLGWILDGALVGEASDGRVSE